MTRILIVEDEAVVVLDLHQTLTQLGYEVIGEAFNGEDALRLVSREMPDLIMMDIVLAGKMDGIETALQLRQQYDRPIIFLTAYSDQKTIDRMKTVQEPFSYIRKPFDQEILRVTIELALYKYHAEREMMFTMRLLQTTMRSIGDGVITTDAKGRVRFINSVAEQLTGWTQDDAEGKPFEVVFDIINEQTRLPAFNPITRVLEEGVILGLANHTIAISRDGRETPIDDSAAPIITRDGEILGAVIVFRDITARREAEMVLRQAQRLDSLGVLAGGVAHDFNNLLTGILAQASLLMAQLDKEGWEAKRVHKIIVSSEHAADLTNQLLDYAGKGTTEKKSIDLNQFVVDNRDFLRTVLPGEVAIQFSEGSVPIHIWADTAQIQQILVNLTRNAWQAINTMEGVIKIETGYVRLDDKELEVYLSKESLPSGDYAFLKVSDNGIGMDAATRERIFDPFFSTRSSGRGLGLTALLGIVYRHDGGIVVESAINVGTTFTTLFPVMNEIPKTPALDQEPQLLKMGNLHGAVILIVDDQEPIREAVVDILESAGATVHAAATGQDAVTFFMEHMDEIDLVVLDIQMPVMGGLDVLKILQAERPNVRVVLSSGYTDSSYRDSVDNSETISFLNKPYRFNELMDVVQALLQK